MSPDIARYAKTGVAVLLAGAYALQAALSDGTVTNTEWLGIGTAALIALGVFTVPNAPAKAAAHRKVPSDPNANIKAGLGYPPMQLTVSGAPRPKRGYGWKPQHPDARDLRVGELPVSYTGTYVDLTSQFPDPPYDQGQLGSCVANGTAAAVDFARLKQGLTPLSPPARLYIYWYGRQLEGTISQDSGLEVRDGFKVIATHGAPAESDYPYNISKFTAKPSAKADADAKLDEAVRYLAVSKAQVYDVIASGYPVVIGFDVPEDFEGDQIAQTGIMPLTSWAGKAIGGHCVVVVSTPKLINGTPSVRVRNSWGTGWGDNGHFWMPTAFLQSEACTDFWMVATMSDPGPQPQPVVTADADDKRMWALNRTWVAGGHGSTTHAVAANLTDWAARKGLT